MPGHAGIFETGLMLALHPALIREPRPHRADPGHADPRGFAPYRTELHGAWQQINGYTDSPDRAEAAHGQRDLALISTAVAQAWEAFYHQPLND
ncbi:MAG: hypothetical protein Fur005_34080 [Roseiflexaceae bacterium]